jgi:TetR/AcrR family transcriptional repressor of nem operon
MRVSREKAAENRVALLQAASRLFRERGIDGVGVADIAKEAGLTHGALYAHFPSKDALAVEAFSHGFAGKMAEAREWAGDRCPSFQEYLDGYLSTDARDRLETGCPLAASVSEIARQDCAVSASFTHAFEEMAAMLESSLDDTIPASERRRLAIAAAAAEIGAIAVSRAVAKADMALADEVLQAVRETVGAGSQSGKSPRRRPA